MVDAKHTMREPAKFVADEMNGDLARWLRILGYDCVYFSNGDEADERIMELAMKQGRILLTSDSTLYKKSLRAGVEAAFTRGVTRHARLAQLMKTGYIDTDLKRRLRRCTTCNALLTETERESVSALTDQRVETADDRIWVCNQCGKVYWTGSHWKGITRTLQQAAQLAGL